MKSSTEIQLIIRAHTKELYNRFGITQLALFGSVVRGETHDTSDIDILVDFDRPIGLLELCTAENYLIDILGSEVDLIPRDTVRSELKNQIYAEAIVI